MNTAFDQSKLLRIGRVMKAHGVRGELKVLPESDEPDRMLELDRVFVGTDPDNAAAKNVLSVRFQQVQKGRIALMRIEGINDRETADSYRNTLVFAHEDDLPALASDEFYWHDLIGSSVRTPEFEIGTLKDVLDMPAHEIFLVEREGRPDAMIPAVPEFIEDIDTDARKIIVRPIEGLLDD